MSNAEGSEGNFCGGHEDLGKVISSVGTSAGVLKSSWELVRETLGCGFQLSKHT